MRLLPKETGVRPIVNLRRVPKGADGRQDSINRILRAAFEVLTYEKVRFSVPKFEGAVEHLP